MLRAKKIKKPKMPEQPAGIKIFKGLEDLGEFQVKKTSHSRYLRIRILPFEPSVLLVPKRCPQREIEKFLMGARDKIIATRHKMESDSSALLQHGSVVGCVPSGNFYRIQFVDDALKPGISSKSFSPNLPEAVSPTKRESALTAGFNRGSRVEYKGELFQILNEPVLSDERIVRSQNRTSVSTRSVLKQNTPPKVLRAESKKKFWYREGNDIHFDWSSAEGQRFSRAATNLRARQMIIREILDEIFRKDAKVFLPKRVRELSEKHGIAVNRVAVKKMSSRWGSCSSAGNINLNIHLVRLPARLIDYVICHELAHVRHPHHGLSFWEYLEKILPGSDSLDREMKKHNVKI